MCCFSDDLLARQQSVAVILKLQTDRAQTMKENEVAQLRAKIKVFQSVLLWFRTITYDNFLN